MNRSIVFSFLILVIFLLSCQSDSSKADKLRLENKFDEAAELYQKAADGGDSYAMWKLSKAYSGGEGVDFDTNKAYELLERAADKGCEEAKCDFALAYMFGWLNVKKDPQKGKELLEKLVKKSKNSYVLARYASLLFFGGYGIEEDKEKSMRILRQIENKEEPYYLSIMGNVYYYGTDEIEIDAEKAVEYYTKAYNRGRFYCADAIQSIYAKGYGSIKPNKEKHIEWLNRGIKSNVTECMGAMALLCLSEDSIYKDLHNPQRGIDLLKRAARHGDGVAYFHLGNYYYNGKYLPKDDNKAFENWEKGAKLNSCDAKGNLAYAYIEGVGCEKNIEKGIELYKQAAEEGSGFSAQKLYVCYGLGTWGVEVNKDLSKKYLLKAAKLNDSWGCYQLGMQYYNGNDLFDRDYGQAFVYIKKAADMGHIDACKATSYFYENGIGVEKNPQKAKEYKDKTSVEDDN